VLRWRFRPILGTGLLPEKSEKHWNDKKRACQKEYKQQPQKPPCMKKVHVFFHQNNSDNDTQRRVKAVHILQGPV
jgi:hypothetical protein